MSYDSDHEQSISTKISIEEKEDFKMRSSQKSEVRVPILTGEFGGG